MQVCNTRESSSAQRPDPIAVRAPRGEDWPVSRRTLETTIKLGRLFADFVRTTRDWSMGIDGKDARSRPCRISRTWCPRINDGPDSTHCWKWRLYSLAIKFGFVHGVIYFLFKSFAQSRLFTLFIIGRRPVFDSNFKRRPLPLPPVRPNIHIHTHWNVFLSAATYAITANALKTPRNQQSDSNILSSVHGQLKRRPVSCRVNRRFGIDSGRRESQ